jgi:hypothetical protein
MGFAYKPLVQRHQRRASLSGWAALVVLYYSSSRTRFHRGFMLFHPDVFAELGTLPAAYSVDDRRYSGDDSDDDQ